MVSGSETLSEIVARARTLAERLALPLPAGPILDTAIVRERVERWRAIVAAGDPDLFEKRLAWDNLTPERVAYALADPSPVGGDTPPWAELLLEIVRETSAWGAAPRPSPVGRMLLRGFLLAVVAARLQAAGPRSGLRLGLRWRLVRVALHLHGLWPPTEGLDRRARRSVRFDLGEPALHALVYHFLRSTLETLPTGRRPLVDDLSLAFATLDAALALGAMRAAQAGRDSLQAEDLVAGLTEAADLGQTGGEGVLAGMLETLTGGLDALRAFAARPEGEAL